MLKKTALFLHGGFPYHDSSISTRLAGHEVRVGAEQGVWVRCGCRRASPPSIYCRCRLLGLGEGSPPGGEEERRQSNKHSRHPGLLLAQTPRSPSVTITGITKAPIHKEPGPSQLLARAAITLQTGNTALDYLGTCQ